MLSRSKKKKKKKTHLRVGMLVITGADPCLITGPLIKQAGEYLTRKTVTH